MSIEEALKSARESLYTLHIIGREYDIFSSAMNNINACIVALEAAKKEEDIRDANNKQWENS